MKFEEFKHQIVKIKKMKLPGAVAHFKMAPKERIRELREIANVKKFGKKAGVLALGLTSKESHQLNFFEPNIGIHNSLMKVIDRINYKYGSRQIKLANQDLDRMWKMKQKNLSPKFTTVLEDIIKVK